ncbi:hypothetical protein HETIRDRAFT_426053 [Heterobasidion irregulare TC 32-1]|uniref:Uncharacterized protein n=1 Tax=Heterobasidion irregulare (strain TC 32-1) TaxID=747525 RepID=W4KIL8_HETIT|nr:uncharacterized protein HETIRDRAFT_426053 [Heterobasidion irregulare TC 32-1]ETW84891.1 hypothetical protein HETIRDRAFT_426053 [Heterobasidion irregulare TC 32-1]
MSFYHQNQYSPSHTQYGATFGTRVLPEVYFSTVSESYPPTMGLYPNQRLDPPWAEVRDRIDYGFHMGNEVAVSSAPGMGHYSAPAQPSWSQMSWMSPSSELSVWPLDDNHVSVAIAFSIMRCRSPMRMSRIRAMLPAPPSSHLATGSATAVTATETERSPPDPWGGVVLGIKPKITMVIVGKRHHVRFFPTGSSDKSDRRSRERGSSRQTRPGKHTIGTSRSSTRSAKRRTNATQARQKPKIAGDEGSEKRKGAESGRDCCIMAVTVKESSLSDAKIRSVVEDIENRIKLWMREHECHFFAEFPVRVFQGEKCLQRLNQQVDSELNPHLNVVVSNTNRIHPARAHAQLDDKALLVIVAFSSVMVKRVDKTFGFGWESAALVCRSQHWVLCVAAHDEILTTQLAAGNDTARSEDKCGQDVVMILENDFADSGVNR